MRNVEKIPRPLRLVAKAVTSEHTRSRLHDWDYHVGQIIDTYRHHLNFCPPTAKARLQTLIQTTGLLIQRPKILCYPDLPGPGSVFYKLCLHQGYRLTNDPAARYDAAIKWRDATYSPNGAILQEIADERRVVNVNLTDISKGHVGEVFGDVFGYELAVDPQTFEGPLLRKSEENAAHDGVIMEGPIQSPAPREYAYQRLVNNIVEDRAVDLRVPIFDSHIPFVRVKYRPVEKRFDHAGQSQVDDDVQPPQNVLSSEEQRLILEMCRRIGLDYGELDVVRDQDTRRIYVVDVNGTPTGPTFVSATRQTVKQCFDEMATSLHTCLFSKTKRSRSPLRDPKPQRS